MASCDTGDKYTRSGGLIIIDFETEYPAIDKFDKQKLPTNKEIIGLAKKLNETKTWDNSIHEVSNIVMNHWIERNVYPITIKTVKKRVRKEVETYLDLKKQIGRSKSKGWQMKAKSFTQNKDKFFDIFCENSEARGNLKKIYQIPMLLEDFQYLESMRTDRKMLCESSIDKECHEKEKMKQKRREKYLHTQYNTTLTAVSDIDDESSSNFDNLEDYRPEKEEDCDISPRKRAIDANTPRRKKAVYKDILEDENDELPHHLRHVRTSEKGVRDEVSISSISMLLLLVIIIYKHMHTILKCNGIYFIVIKISVLL